MESRKRLWVVLATLVLSFVMAMPGVLADDDDLDVVVLCDQNDDDDDDQAAVLCATFSSLAASTDNFDEVVDGREQFIDAGLVVSPFREGSEICEDTPWGVWAILNEEPGEDPFLEGTTITILINGVEIAGAGQLSEIGGPYTDGPARAILFGAPALSEVDEDFTLTTVTSIPDLGIFDSEVSQMINVVECDDDDGDEDDDD